MEHLQDGRQGRLPREGGPAGQELIEDGPEGIDVRGRADRLAGDHRLFGGHVIGRAQQLPRDRGTAKVRRLPVAAGALGQAEVGDLGDEGREARGEGREVPGLAPRPFPLVPQEDVGRLEIAVNHAVGMSGMDGPRQGLDQLCRRTHRLGRALEVLGQAAAGHELEDKVRPARGLADIVDLDDVGMLQASDRRGLGAKAGQVLRAGLDPGQDHLQRHGAIETELPGLVDDAHAASSQLPQDLVARHGRPFAAHRRGPADDRVGRVAGRPCRLHRIGGRQPRGPSLQAPHHPFFGLGAPGRMLGAPPRLRVRGPGQAGQLFLARGASFHVPREGVPFRRAQSVGQQACEFLVGGTESHERVPGRLG